LSAGKDWAVLMARLLGADRRTLGAAARIDPALADPEEARARPFPIARRRRPEVVDDGGVRRLYFDRRYVQSAMRLNAPYALELAYTRFMMSFLLLVEAPADILLVGLGGGSLAKFCHHYLPGARITVVESDAEVIALRDRFAVPEDERLRILHADAADYLPACAGAFDVILLDGCDADGMAPSLSTPMFYRAAARCLRAEGVLVANLVGERQRWLGQLRLMWNAFDRRVRILGMPQEGDHYLALAFHDPELYRLPPSIEAAAARLGGEIPLDLPRLARWLRKEDLLA
jgi:spermidine synthase